MPPRLGPTREAHSGRTVRGVTSLGVRSAPAALAADGRPGAASSRRPAAAVLLGDTALFTLADSSPPRPPQAFFVDALRWAAPGVTPGQRPARACRGQATFSVSGSVGTRLCAWRVGLCVRAAGDRFPWAGGPPRAKLAATARPTSAAARDPPGPSHAARAGHVPLSPAQSRLPPGSDGLGWSRRNFLSHNSCLLCSIRRGTTGSIMIRVTTGIIGPGHPPLTARALQVTRQSCTYSQQALQGGLQVGHCAGGAYGPAYQCLCQPECQ